MIQLSSSRFLFLYTDVAVPMGDTYIHMRCRLFLGQDVKGSVADCWRRDFTFGFFFVFDVYITYIYIPFFHPFMYIYIYI